MANIDFFRFKKPPELREKEPEKRVFLLSNIPGKKELITRRMFLKLAGSGATSLALAACAPSSADNLTPMQLLELLENIYSIKSAEWINQFDPSLTTDESHALSESRIYGFFREIPEGMSFGDSLTEADGQRYANLIGYGQQSIRFFYPRMLFGQEMEYEDLVASGFYFLAGDIEYRVDVPKLNKRLYATGTNIALPVCTLPESLIDGETGLLEVQDNWSVSMGFPDYVYIPPAQRNKLAQSSDSLGRFNYILGQLTTTEDTMHGYFMEYAPSHDSTARHGLFYPDLDRLSPLIIPLRFFPSELTDGPATFHIPLGSILETRLIPIGTNNNIAPGVPAGPDFTNTNFFQVRLILRTLDSGEQLSIVKD